jgi:protein O-GlcNAc transferase
MSSGRQMAGSPDVGAYIRQAIGLHQAGHLPAAEQMYREILKVQPHNYDALHLLGVLLHQNGESDAGLRFVERSLKHHRKFLPALNSKGLILGQLKRYKEALASFDSAIAMKHDYPAALNGRGNMLHELQRYEEALASYDRAIRVSPEFAEAYFNKGNTLNKLERYQEALVSYTRAIAIQPTLAEAWFNQANTLLALDRPEEALASYDRTIALRRDHPEAHCKKGEALHALNRLKDATASFDQAISLRPDYHDAWKNRGATLAKAHQYTDALASLARALVIKPDDATTLLNYATAQYGNGNRPEALATIKRYLSKSPMDPRGRFLQVMWTLPIISHSEEEAIESRTAYEASLRSLINDLDGVADLGRFAEGVGIAQPFYLTYQGQNDRQLQQLYGSLVSRIMAHRYGAPPALPAPPHKADRVRIGIVSGFFHRHVLWRMAVKGWVSQLDRRRFEVFGYYTGNVRDDDTEDAIAMCDRFVQGPMTANRWRHAILSDAPHVLIYSEVGMDPMAARLAAQRLAPVQCNSLGHPVTCGFPTMDYYLTSDAMEPADGQAYYTEQLVRLPNLSFYYEPKEPPTVGVSRAELGLSDSAIVFWCGQSLYKYLPRYDDVFPRIAREVGDCQFAFIEYHGGGNVTEIFRERLSLSFSKFGLDAAKHCVFLPRMSEDRFVAAIGQCDIVLDSIGWAGNNSTLEGLANDVPIVAMAGPFMRGRHTSAMLGLIGSEETIAATPEQYIEIAVRLAREPDWRSAMGQRVAKGKDRLFRDRQAIMALEEFVDRASRTVSVSPLSNR